MSSRESWAPFRGRALEPRHFEPGGQNPARDRASAGGVSRSRMRKVTLAFALAAVVAVAASCGAVRTTGPKSAYDRCVDECDLAWPHCSDANMPCCEIEYTACVVHCDRSTEAQR